MKIDIDQLSESELVDLNHRIVMRLRFLDQMRAHAAMMQFSIGNRVSFDPPGRPTVTGVIVKYNKKSVTVIAEDGRHWTVSPTMLRKAEIDVTPKAGTENVVSINRK